MRQIGPTELALIAGIIVLLFGAAKLPEVARGTGRALRIFRTETRGLLETATDPDGNPVASSTAESTPER